MAQVYYGEVQASTYILLSVVVDEDRSTFGQSKLTITLRGRRTNSYNGNTGNLTGTFTVSGGMSGSSSALFLIPPYNNDWIYFTHITTTIYHTDAQAVNFSWSSSAGTHLSGSGSGSFTLAGFIPPTVTGSISNLTHNSVTLNGDITSYGSGTSGFLGARYRLVGSSTWTDLAIKADTGSPQTWNVTGLSANTKYEYVIAGTNNLGGSASTVAAPFTTLGFGTASTSNISATSFNVSVAQSLGNQPLPLVSIMYKVANPAVTVWQETPTQQVASPIFTITGLNPSTDYVCKAKINNGNSYYTSELSVTTLPAVIIIKTNGTVVNAIPYLVKTNGTVTQLDPKIIRKN